MKATRNLVVCVMALVVVSIGPAIANQDQTAGITSGAEAGSELRGQQQAPTCSDLGDPGFLLGQDPHNPGDPDWNIMSSHQTTWGTWITAETLDQAADPDWFDISSITVWGLSIVSNDGIFACDPTGMNFDVIFYEETAGEPGTVICNLQSVAPTITNTGVQYSGRVGQTRGESFVSPAA